MVDPSEVDRRVNELVLRVCRARAEVPLLNTCIPTRIPSGEAIEKAIEEKGEMESDPIKYAREKLELSNYCYFIESLAKDLKKYAPRMSEKEFDMAWEYFTKASKEYLKGDIESAKNFAKKMHEIGIKR